MTAVLFATEFDTANVILDLLTDPTNYYLFPLIVRYKASNRVEFVLQTLRCPNSVRVGTVLVCDAKRLGLSRYVDFQVPIPTREIRAALDVEATRAIYEPLFACRSSEDDDPTKRGDPARLSHLVFFNRTAVLEFLNDTFLTPTSPSWFLNTFGGYEGTALLSMSYYLFERQLSTIQTTRGYTVCYTANPGAPIANHVTMREFMSALLKSRFRKEVERFARYAKARNARDAREMDYVDEKIDQFREASRLPADTCIYYTYLAYSTALSREKILKYCEHAEFRPELDDSDQCTQEENFLGRSLEDDLLRLMKEYFSPEAYFQTYVQVERVAVPPDAGYEGYDWKTDSPAARVFYGSSAQVHEELRRLNDKTEDLFDPAPTTLSGLLQLCASRRSIPLENVTSLDRATRRNYLMNTSKTDFGPLPAFRIEMPGRRHIFACLSSDDWTRRLAPANLQRDLPDGHAPSDETITEILWPREEIEARQKFSDQLYRTRHEFFNERLPVFNFVGDLDLKLRDDAAAGIGKRDFFDLLRTMREALLDAWVNLFPDGDVDRESYPVYFFKSACDDSGYGAVVCDGDLFDGGIGGGIGGIGGGSSTSAAAEAASPLDMYDEDDESSLPYEPPSRSTQNAVFCTCRRKIGMRIVIPFPRGTVVVGSTTMKRLARTLDHALCLNRDLVLRLNGISNPGDCFDTGVYGNGRSVRMPLMYKLDESGFALCRRLNPIYVVPPRLRASPHDFILAHFRPENLTHHGNPHRGAPVVSALVHITDRACGEGDVSFTQKYINRDERTPEPSLYPAIRRLLALAKTDPTAHARATDWYDLDADDDDDDVDDDYQYGEDTSFDREDGGDLLHGVPLRPRETRDLREFARAVAWPKVLSLARGHYRPEVLQQLEEACVFQPLRRDLVAVKRGASDRGRDFRCLTYDHQFRWRETVNVFLDLRADQNQNVWVTLWSRCFATKCNSNARQTHLTVKISPPSQY